jgi:hypothetical protein
MYFLETKYLNMAIYLFSYIKIIKIGEKGMPFKLNNRLDINDGKFWLEAFVTKINYKS